MSKKPAKASPPADADAAEAPKKRSKVKLAIFALVPLLLAGGGYFGYTQFFAKPADAAGHEAAEDGGHGPDPLKVAAVDAEIAAETSATHSFALSVLLTNRCGPSETPALKAASETEAHADGMLVSLSWQAAARRVSTTTRDSCGKLLGEVEAAEAKAAAPAGSKAGNHGKPAAAH